MNSDEGITIIYFSIYIFCSQRHNYFIFTFYHNFTNSNLLWIQLPAQDPAGLLDKSIFIYHGLLPKKNSMRVHFCMTILPGSGDQVYIYISCLKARQDPVQAIVSTEDHYQVNLQTKIWQ